MTREPSSVYAISLPIIEDDTYSFYFQSELPDGIGTFTFKWFNDKWNIKFDHSNGDTRLASVYPEVIAWGGYSDYSLMIRTNNESVGQNQLSDISMYMVYW